jgi:PIN domain nuclease of toxin-antitoxin system
MKLLLDTHALLWFMLGDRRMSSRARTKLEDLSNEVFVSVASIWEIATKVRIGKLLAPDDLLQIPKSVLIRMGFHDLPLTLSHARLGDSFAHPHKDPFDRMLAAQAILEGLTLVSADTVFDSMPVTRLW